MNKKGVFITLVGSDYCGKTTVANSLQQELQREGIKNTLINWKTPLCDPNPDLVVEVLSSSILNFYKLFVGMLNIKGKGKREMEKFKNNFPKSYADFKNSLIYKKLIMSADFSVPKGLFYCLTIMEVATFSILYQRYVLPLLKKNFIVISDSWAYKNVVKDLIALKLCVCQKEDAVKFNTFSKNIYEIIDIHIKGDFTFLLDADINAIGKWKDKKISLFESSRVIGSKKNQAFQEFQEEIKAEYSRLAQMKGWNRIKMLDRNKSENIMYAVRRIREVTRL